MIMREILFRGQTRRLGEKVRINGEKVPSNWVYGGVCQGKYAFSIIYGSMDEERENPIEKHVVYTDTLGQYTGLTDKNGKKIFEGDIVEFYFFDKTRRNGELVEVKNTKTMLIEWYDASFYMKELFRNYRLDKEMGIITEVIYDYKGDRRQGVYTSNRCYFVEVIGNIHDNPELLE